MNLKREDVQREMDQFLHQKQLQLNTDSFSQESGISLQKDSSASNDPLSSDKHISNELKFNLPASQSSHPKLRHTDHLLSNISPIFSSF